MNKLHIRYISLCAIFPLGLLILCWQHSALHYSMTRLATHGKASDIIRSITSDWDIGKVKFYAHPNLSRKMDDASVQGMVKMVQTLGPSIEKPVCNLISATAYDGPEGNFDLAGYQCPVRTANTSAVITMVLRKDADSNWLITDFNINSPFLDRIINQYNGSSL